MTAPLVSRATSFIRATPCRSRGVTSRKAIEWELSTTDDHKRRFGDAQSALHRDVRQREPAGRVDRLPGTARGEVRRALGAVDDGATGSLGDRLTVAQRVGALVAVVVTVDDEVDGVLVEQRLPARAVAAVGAVHEVRAVHAVVESDHDEVDARVGPHRLQSPLEPAVLGGAEVAVVARDLERGVVAVEGDEADVGVDERVGHRGAGDPVGGRGEPVEVAVVAELPVAGLHLVVADGGHPGGAVGAGLDHPQPAVPGGEVLGLRTAGTSATAGVGVAEVAHHERQSRIHLLDQRDVLTGRRVDAHVAEGREAEGLRARGRGGEPTGRGRRAVVVDAVAVSRAGLQPAHPAVVVDRLDVLRGRALHVDRLAEPAVGTDLEPRLAHRPGRRPRDRHRVPGVVAVLQVDAGRLDRRRSGRHPQHRRGGYGGGASTQQGAAGGGRELRSHPRSLTRISERALNIEEAADQSRAAHPH